MVFEELDNIIEQLFHSLVDTSPRDVRPWRPASPLHLSEQDITERTPVWQAISDLWLAQELEESVAWTDPELVLSQTCGMPYRTRLHVNVTLIGTPDFGVAGCAPGYYRSAIVVRRDDSRAELPEYRDAVLAYNNTDSQSGFAAIYHHVAPLGFWFGNRLHAGRHIDSVGAVAEGRADIASIDAVS